MTAEQRSPEWYAARNRRITASRFHVVLGKHTSAGYRNYLRDVAEAIRGVPSFDDIAEPKPWFAHGVEWEQQARAQYEFHRGIDVAVPGLIVHPEIPYVAGSPDGLVGEDGGIDIKCHKSLGEYQKCVGELVLPSRHIAQVQGYLWITGRKWWDLVDFYRDDSGDDIRMYIVSAERDERYHDTLRQACAEFWARANDLAGGKGQ